MKVNVTHEEELAVIAASGELDANTVPLLRAAIDQALARGARQLLFDLHGLDFIGSVGIGELLRAAKLLAQRDGEVAVTCCRPNVVRVFEISGTGEFLHLRAEESAARAALEESRRRLAWDPGQEGEGHGQAE